MFVVVSDGRSGRATGAARVRIEQLPSGCTAGDLARRLAEGRSSDQLHLRMLVRALPSVVHVTWFEDWAQMQGCVKLSISAQ